MKKNFKFIMVAAAAIALIGCAKDGGDNTITPGEKGEGVKASFTIKLPAGSTRGYTNVPGSTEESKITNAKVFIFDNSDRLETMADLTVTDGGTKASNSEVRTTSGSHTVFVAVNIPAKVTENLEVTSATDNGTALATFRGIFLDLIAGGKGDKLSNITADEMFFMTAEKPCNFKVPTSSTEIPNENKVVMTMQRAVAKVTMTQKKNGVNGDTEDMVQPANGTVGDLTFKVMNNPISQYAFKNTDGNYIYSPITGDGSNRNNYFRIPGDTAADYKAVSTQLYVPENAGTTDWNATSLLIKGQYTPKANTADVTYTADAAGDAAAYTADADFWRVLDKGNGVWLKTLFTAEPTTDGIKRAAGINALTNIYRTNVKYGADPANTNSYPEYYVVKYTGGIAYWSLMLRNEEKPSGKAQYEVERNDFFRVKITSVSDLGAASDVDGDPDGPLGPDPEPIDEPVNISCEISVAPWRGIDQDGQI